MLPAGAHRNKEFRRKMVRFESSVELYLQDIMFDPQTSGGLLICIDKTDASDLMTDLVEKENLEAALN